MSDSNSCIARIFDQHGIPSAGGLVVSGNKILTCAHVIVSVLGEGRAPNQPPQTSIIFDLPQLAHKRTFTAYTDFWDRTNDVAVLSANCTLPYEAQSFTLTVDKDLWGHSFSVFGFPEGYSNGVWVSGVLGGRSANNWLQVEGKSGSGYIIQPGFSGSPVFDKQAGGIVGIITVSDLNPQVRAAYVIPSDTLICVVPELRRRVLSSVTRLGQLHVLSETELQRKLTLYQNRISLSRKSEDLLSMSLTLLMLRSFDQAVHFLEEFLSEKPFHAYGWYALALAALKGERPRLLTYDRAVAVHKQVLQAVQLDSNLTQAALLLALLTSDYFESKGFQVNPNLRACLSLVQQKGLDREEVLALLKLFPNDNTIPLIRTIRAAAL